MDRAQMLIDYLDALPVAKLLTRDVYGPHGLEQWRRERYVAWLAGGEDDELAGPCARDTSCNWGIHNSRARTLQDFALVAYGLRPDCGHDDPQLPSHRFRHSVNERGQLIWRGDHHDDDISNRRVREVVDRMNTSRRRVRYDSSRYVDARDFMSPALNLQSHGQTDGPNSNERDLHVFAVIANHILIFPAIASLRGPSITNSPLIRGSAPPLASHKYNIKFVVVG